MPVPIVQAPMTPTVCGDIMWRTLSPAHRKNGQRKVVNWSQDGWIATQPPEQRNHKVDLRTALTPSLLEQCSGSFDGRRIETFGKLVHYETQRGHILGGPILALA